VAQIQRGVHEAFRDTSAEALKCAMCRWRGPRCALSAGRCSGRCCSFCRHHPAAAMQGRVTLRQAAMQARELIHELQLHRRAFLGHLQTAAKEEEAEGQRNSAGAGGGGAASLRCPWCHEPSSGTALAYKATGTLPPTPLPSDTRQALGRPLPPLAATGR